MQLTVTVSNEGKTTTWKFEWMDNELHKGLWMLFSTLQELLLMYPAGVALQSDLSISFVEMHSYVFFFGCFVDVIYVATK